MTDEPQDTRYPDAFALLLAETPVPDDGFTVAVMASLARRRTMRRVALTVGWSAAALLTIAAVPATVRAWSGLDVQMLAAAMPLSAICGVVWIATAE